MNKEQAKKEIKRLIEKYERVKEQGKLKRYNEEMTKKSFIEPFFRALGWDIEDSEEVTAEEKISKGRVDYGFKINEIPKFYLEAKALKIDIENRNFIEQAINYSWHKGCTWAILTNFENIKVLNAEWKTHNPLQNQFLSISYKSFLEKFDKLWWLSKESFEESILDKEAEEVGKKSKRVSIDKQLLSDLMNFRSLLYTNINKNNKKLSFEDIEESIQRILDRLIFIRTCEDRKLEPPILEPLIRENSQRNLYKGLSSIFRTFDDNYNSKLFLPHLCEDLIINDKIIQDIIKGLYTSKDKIVKYDFAIIDADVLGNMYEQYLGHIIKKVGRGVKLKDTKPYRKEKGIYYTPPYVVDYIVKNTIGELVKNKKFDINKIKILDPACGSGSFLIKAFDCLVKYHSKKGSIEQMKLDTNSKEATFSKKLEILKNNIFGVDLDAKAVEIAQLNLLLRVAEKKHRLPTLQENIRCGNSLIDDPKVAGNKAFKWQEEFKEIMEGGGFDIVVGNPPYGYRGIPTSKIKEIYSKKYVTSEGNFDMYRFFIERSINLLKNKGMLGFIVPNTFLTAKFYKKLRKFILDNCHIKKIVDLGLNVFEQVTLESIILILQKDLTKEKTNKVRISVSRSRGMPLSDPSEEYDVPQEKFRESKDNLFNIYLSPIIRKLTKKIERESVSLEKIACVTVGINTGYIKNVLVSSKKINDKYHKLLSGRDISRYSLRWPGEWILYDKKVVDSYGDKGRTLPDELIFKKNKILVQRTRRGMARKLICTSDTKKFYNLNRLSNVVMNNKNYSLKYCLGILNSTLMDFYFQKTFNEYEVKPTHLRQLPIKQLLLIKQKPLIFLVDKMLSLNEQLNKIGDKKTDERVRIEEEIKRIDKQIDELVYKLYGISNKEKKIIEDSLR